MTIDVTVRIPRDIAETIGARELGPDKAVLTELGVALLTAGRISATQTRNLLGLSSEELRGLLEARRIPWRYDVRDADDLSEVSVSLR